MRVELLGWAASRVRAAAGWRWRYLLDLRRAFIDEVEKRVRLLGTYVGNELVDVDGVSLA